MGEGETVNLQLKSSRINARTTKRAGRMLCFAATLITFNGWVMINAILDRVSRMRTKYAPPPCTTGSILGILVYAFDVLPAGPSLPPTPCEGGVGSPVDRPTSALPPPAVSHSS